MRSRGLFGLQLGQVGLVSVQDRLFQGMPRLRRDGVGNITECPILILAAGHRHKEPLRPLNDLDIVYSQVAVYGDLNQRLQPCVLVNFADPNIGDIHACFSFQMPFIVVGRRQRTE